MSRQWYPRPVPAPLRDSMVQWIGSWNQCLNPDAQPLPPATQWLREVVVLISTAYTVPPGMLNCGVIYAHDAIVLHRLPLPITTAPFLGEYMYSNGVYMFSQEDVNNHNKVMICYAPAESEATALDYTPSTDTLLGLLRGSAAPISIKRLMGVERADI